MELRCLIDGVFAELVPPEAGSPHPSASPGDIERALVAASRVHEEASWLRLTVEERCEFLAKAPEELNRISASIATIDSNETGVPIQVTRDISNSLAETFTPEALRELCSALAPKTINTSHGPLRQAWRPHGPAVILAPWNVPSATVAGKLAAALAAGCPVIVKPSEWAARGLELFLRAVNATGLPPGVLQWVHGGPDVGAALVANKFVRVVHFTGSALVGRQVHAHCAEQCIPLCMECGGSNVAIVLKDAKIDATAAAVTTGLTLLNGQWCAGISRVLVHEDKASELIECVLQKIASLKIGKALDESTELGPLANAPHLRRIEEICAGLLERGGNLHRAPVEMPPSGHFFPPTLITGADGEPVGEIFGPLATVQTFKDPVEAVRLANLRPLLQCYIFGDDAKRCMDLGSNLCCGSVMINGVGFAFDFPPDAPCKEPPLGFFSGSGLGIEAGAVGAAHFFAGPQNVGING